MTRILLIDDSRYARTTLKQALGDGFEYLEAADALSGLELYFLEKPELVILDLTMPGMNGLEMLAQLKAIEPAARVIVCSADVQEFSQQEALRLGAARFLAKPIAPEHLRTAVSEVLERET